MSTTSTKHRGRPRIREGLPHLYLTPPSVYHYNQGCRCDDCKDEKLVSANESKARIKAANEELWEHIAQIRERMNTCA